MGQRIITGVILGIIALAAILVLPTAGFALFTGIAVLMAGFEWFRLSCPDEPPRLAALIGLMSVSAALFTAAFPAQFLWVAVLGSIYWLFMLVRLVRHRRDAIIPRPPWMRALSGLFVLSVFWYAINRIHVAADGPWLLIFGMLIVTTADSLAYFAGRQWGRHKLAPAISPGKSIEGVIGGLVGVAVLAGIGAVLPIFHAVPSWQLGLWSALVALVSVAGDLEESRLKREVGAKDSGRLLPGHGGLLDRLDGQFAAMPVWLLALWQMHLLGGLS